MPQSKLVVATDRTADGSTGTCQDHEPNNGQNNGDEQPNQRCAGIVFHILIFRRERTDNAGDPADNRQCKQQLKSEKRTDTGNLLAALGKYGEPG